MAGPAKCIATILSKRSLPAPKFPDLKPSLGSGPLEPLELGPGGAVRWV